MFKHLTASELIEELQKVDGDCLLYVTRGEDNTLQPLTINMIGNLPITEEDLFDECPYKLGDNIFSIGQYACERNKSELPDTYHPRREDLEDRRYPLAEKLIQALYRKPEMSDEEWEEFDLDFIKSNGMSYRKIQTSIEIEMEISGNTLEQIIEHNKNYLENRDPNEGLTHRQIMFNNARNY